MMRLTCVLIGQGQQCIACGEELLARGSTIVGAITDCPELTGWLAAKGIARASASEDAIAFLSSRPFDLLFSIVNHAVTSPEVLALPRLRAINYHDSPLPEYGGFNATAWAILEGKLTHAVTWHEMTQALDGGTILVQEDVPIASDDTAFTLAAKCSEAGVRAFSRLLDALTAGHGFDVGRRGTPSFHLRSERPDIGVLDFSRATSTLVNQVRGLNFGTEDNWMCRAKLYLGPGAYVVAGEASALGSEPRATQPGRILALGADRISVSTSDGALELGELRSLSGEPISTQELGIAVGSVLPLVAALRDSAAPFDAKVTRNERFWVKRLATLSPAHLSELTLAQRGAPTRRVVRTFPAPLLGAELEVRQAAACAALIAYLARVGNADAGFDIGCATQVPAALLGLYADVVPLRALAPTQGNFSALQAAVRDELQLIARRGCYARDVLQRYRVLWQNKVTEPAFAVTVRLNGSAPSDELPRGVRLQLVLTETGDHYSWVYDTSSLTEAAAEALFERFDALLTSAQSAPDTLVSALPIVSERERSLLLGTWQETAQDYNRSQCVHELFQEQVRRSGNKVAVVFRERQLTYSELDRRANAVAWRLVELGVKPDTLVGICIERSLEMMIGLLGILKAGAAYVPLDPAYPKNRLAVVIEDSNAPVLLTQRHLAARLPEHSARDLFIDDLTSEVDAPPVTGVLPEHLAYVIFTSGSTGRPKGVMVTHRNVSNFFTGMDGMLDAANPGVWLAVTSISFDISVLELFWTLTRGFEVVIQEESDRASLAANLRTRPSLQGRLGFGLFYFAADSSAAQGQNAYRLMLEGAKFADRHGFDSVWTPERHFHAFGGLYPNAAVTTAALAVATERIQLRAGSVVLPLHNPIRVAEDWAVVDNLSGGRVGLSFASGWHANDFALMPDNYEQRRDVMFKSIDTVLALWRGEKHTVVNGIGQTIQISVLPRPVRERPPIWIASAGSVDTFIAAGKLGYNVLTNMLGQDIDDLRAKFAAYREARAQAGYHEPGTISVMLHTFVCDDDAFARRVAKQPFCDYLAASYDLVKVAPWMFPAFKKPSTGGDSSAFDAAQFDAADMAALLDHAFDRYFETAGLFGTPERALAVARQLQEIGATEVACLIDFGIEPQVVLDNLVHLERLRQLCDSPAVQAAEPEAEGDYSIHAQIERRGVTHLQCTPSMARILLIDGSADSLKGVRKLLLGGEALTPDLVDVMASKVGGEILNMYGPTETTIWSTTARVRPGQPISIGRPIANTTIRITDAKQQLLPIGTPGELCIGGEGVVRGYLNRADLTTERFVPDPYQAGARLYRTGDLARYRTDGSIEYIGRMDFQVKVNGYRIELGEIESALARHPAVQQSVVSVHTEAGNPQLVAYIVEAGTSRDPQHGSVDAWQGRWNEAYSTLTETETGKQAARFNTSGWLSSYDAAPIPTEDMREWLDGTTQRILATHPKRVLEIGCGTGMILYRLLDQVERYTAVDVSLTALELIRSELSALESPKVRLLNQPAHSLEGVDAEALDTVIINSVAQYFPNTEYLTSVVQRAIEGVADGGRVFIGDVRSLAHLPMFCTLVELFKAPDGCSASELGTRVAERVKNEPELLLAPEFFVALRRSNPRIRGIEWQLKRGRRNNEMTAFRYDVILHIGEATLAQRLAVPAPAPQTYDGLVQILQSRPDSLCLTGFRNARLSAVRRIGQQIVAGAVVTVEQLRQTALLTHPIDDAQPGTSAELDPETLWSIDPEYDVELRFGHEPHLFDALLRRRAAGLTGLWPCEPVPASSAPEAFANQPVHHRSRDELTSSLRSRLRELVPDYMVPSQWVFLEQFPLTPNGKIDRKALPAPSKQTAALAQAVVLPANELERQIAAIWEEILGKERVGRDQNIFELGASSLSAVAANARLSELLGRKTPLVNMFRYPTIASLATAVGGSSEAEVAVNAERAQAREDRQQSAADRRRAARARLS